MDWSGVVDMDGCSRYGWGVGGCSIYFEIGMGVGTNQGVGLEMRGQGFHCWGGGGGIPSLAKNLLTTRKNPPPQTHTHNFYPLPTKSQFSCCNPIKILCHALCKHKSC